MADKLPPVDHIVNVPLAPADAFELFTRQVRSEYETGWPVVLARLAEVPR